MAAPRRNIELKASDPDPERSLAVVKGLGAHDRGIIRQCDTYFRVHTGRLKLREEEPGGATLIQYDRVAQLSEALGLDEARILADSYSDRVLGMAGAEELAAAARGDQRADR